MRQLALGLVVLWGLSARAEEVRLEHQTFTLANGLRVFVLPNHRSPTVQVLTGFKVGSKDELPGRSGFAHLFEHLMFKGSAHVPDGLMDRLLAEGGGDANGVTTRDLTIYLNQAAANFLEPIFWLDADRLAGLTETIDQPKLDNQRDVVRNERRHWIDNQPYGEAQILIPAALWPAEHGYHQSVIGRHQDLEAATLDDVKAFFRAYYVPNNAVMVVAGDVDVARVRPLVEKYFGWIPRGAEPRRRVSKPPPPIAREIQLTATSKVQVPRVYVAWRAPAVYSAEEPALQLAAAILGEGKSSRLHERLIFRERLAQDARTYIEADALGGIFQLAVTARPGVAPADLVRAVSEEVARLSTTPPSAEELERARNSREARFLTELEPMLPRAWQFLDYVLRADDPDFLAKDLARYRAVTAAQVTAAAARHLGPSARVVLTIGPEGGK